MIQNTGLNLSLYLLMILWQKSTSMSILLVLMMYLSDGGAVVVEGEVMPVHQMVQGQHQGGHVGNVMSGQGKELQL